MRRRPLWPTLALGTALACGRGAPPPPASGTATPPPDEEPPVALNPDPPIQYPPALYDQRVEGTVVLRLFVDSTGKLAPESTRVSEGSGYPALDSAAMAGAGKLQFAPARRHGLAVSTLFLQPIEFHQGTPGATALSPPAAPRPRPPATATSPAPARPRVPRVRVDTARPPVDTTKARPDSTKVPPDTNAVAH